MFAGLDPPQRRRGTEVFSFTTELFCHRGIDGKERSMARDLIKSPARLMGHICNCYEHTVFSLREHGLFMLIERKMERNGEDQIGSPDWDHAYVSRMRCSNL